ncbi:hypothetical protein GCM10010329_61050 [Streptomyces spiroverticillatus]|uniref:SHOCT domain-containing protein n=1 Tax=Streptomyces finlayi TaxID=67296 RepID=A0A919CD99_9ACTN|nr:hypothetical protein GCM10010329_61050 [Streptomyces spiroverticillatus]GHD09914.1 hypothetical protein GCM10010334_64710 [Streptomyces finlayi]
MPSSRSCICGLPVTRSQAGSDATHISARIAGDDTSVVGQLAQLGRLAQQGLITPEEFAAAKAKLLGT